MNRKLVAFFCFTLATIAFNTVPFCWYHNIVDYFRQQAKLSESHQQLLLKILSEQLSHHSANISQHFLDGSIVYNGSHAWLDLAILKILSAEPDKRHLRLAAVGGSNTAGHFLQPEDIYLSQLGEQLTEILKPLDINVTYDNVALGATHSLYFAMCIEQHLNLSQYDIIFLEFSINDALTCSGIEELVRALWRVNPLLQIVYLHFSNLYFYFADDPPALAKMTDRKWKPTGWGDSFIPCNIRVKENIHFDVAKIYNIPVIQMVHPLFEMYNLTHLPVPKDERMKAKAKYLARDQSHPNRLLHNYVSEYFIYYFKQAVENLLQRALSNPAIITEREIAMAESRIVYEWSSIQEKAPLFHTTWIDATDCFMSFEHPFRRSDALNRALIDKSPSIDFSRLVDRLTEALRNSKPSAETEVFCLVLPPGTVKPAYLSFSIDASLSLRRNIPCGSGRYIPRLAIAHRRYNSFGVGHLTVHVTLSFEDGTGMNSTYQFTLRDYRANTNTVDLVTAAAGNREGFVYAVSPIKRLAVTITQASRHYPFTLLGIVVTYDCCS